MFRSSPTTPRHAGTPNQVSFASAPGIPARKGTRTASSPRASAQRQPLQQQKKQRKQLHRLSSWPVVGGDGGGGGGVGGWSSGGIVGGNANAASPREIGLGAGSGWGGAGFHTATGVIEVGGPISTGFSYTCERSLQYLDRCRAPLAHVSGSIRLGVEE